MTIQNIETADNTLLKTAIINPRMEFFFAEVYDAEKEEHIKNVTLVIKNWFVFKATQFVSSSPGNGEEKTLSFANLETFDLIQEKIIEENTLTLKGFSKESGHWMEYYFQDYEYEFVKQ